MADKPNPMEPLRILTERVAETLTQLGLQPINVAFLPNLEGGPNMVQIVAVVDEDAATEVVEDDVQKAADDEVLKEMERQMVKEKDAEKLDKTKEGLLKLQQSLEEGKGILGDE